MSAVFDEAAAPVYSGSTIATARYPLEKYDSVQDLLALAQLAERAEQYHDVLKFMKSRIDINSNLNGQERELLSSAFKELFRSRRDSLQKIFAKRKSKSFRDVKVSADNKKLELQALEYFEAKMRKEVEVICQDAIQLVQDTLLGPAVMRGDNEAAVFYLKMLADNYRYLGELDPGDKMSENIQRANRYYDEALPLAEEVLFPEDVTRLQLVLNMSAFYFQAMKKPDRACSIAKKGYDSAASRVDSLPADKAAQVKSLLQLIRYNLDVWTSMDN